MEYLRTRRSKRQPQGARFARATRADNRATILHEPTGTYGTDRRLHRQGRKQKQHPSATRSPVEPITTRAAILALLILISLLPPLMVGSANFPSQGWGPVMCINAADLFAIINRASGAMFGSISELNPGGALSQKSAWGIGYDGALCSYFRPWVRREMLISIYIVDGLAAVPGAIMPVGRLVAPQSAFRRT